MSSNTEAQQKSNFITGEYYLRGVMEIAAGFKLNADSTFDFFFSYGALDREGKGTWKQERNYIVLNSQPGSQGFALISSNTVAGENITIKITEENSFLKSHVYSILKSNGSQATETTNQDGIINFPKQQIDSIQLISEFCPEKVFTFSNSNKALNYFEFKCEKDLMDVFFNNLVFTLSNKGLEGKLPLLKEGIYHFEKN